MNQPTKTNLTERVPPRWLLLALAASINLVWALSYPISKSLIGQLSPLALSTARVVGAAVLLAPLVRRADFPKDARASEYLLLAAMGLCACALPAYLQYLGTARSTSSNVAMIVSLEPSSVALLSALVLKERIRKRQVAALLLALVGVAVITVDPQSLSLLSSRYLAGNAILLGSVFFYSSYTIASKRLSERWGTSALTIVPFAVATIVMLPAMAVVRPDELHRMTLLSRTELLEVAFTVVLATAVGYAVWNWLLRWLSASEVALSLYIQPIAGALLSTWLLGEKLAAFFIIGSLLVLVALALGQPRRTD